MRALFGGAAILAATLALTLVHTQATTFDLGTLQPVAPENVPSFGTFYSLQLFDIQPPFPFDPHPELQVYSFSGFYVVDDSSIDYGDIYSSESDEEGDSEMSMMGAAYSVPASDCVTNGQVYLTNVFSILDPDFGRTVTFTIAGVTNGIPYNIFTTTNLDGTNVPWTWLDQGYTCNTYTYTNQPKDLAFYILGRTNDTDGDGLSDAFELLSSRTDPANADQNTDGIPDGWEWNNFGNLNQATNADYDSDGINNWDEYIHHSEPNDIGFFIIPTNRFVNSGTLALQLCKRVGSYD